MELEKRTADTHFMTWRPEYSVQIDAIDSQHKALVGLIRELQEAMEEGRGRAFQHTLIERLVAYVDKHFSFEENLMRERGYEGFAEHLELHRAMVSQVSKIQQTIQAGGAVSNASLMLFLRHWLTDHIMEHDQKYARALKIGS
jgi:hemerythrin-like metal-binding protein